MDAQAQGGGDKAAGRPAAHGGSRLGTHPAPVERPGEVVSCSQRKNRHRRLWVHLQLVQSGQDPAHLQGDVHTRVSGGCPQRVTRGNDIATQSYRAVPPAGEDAQIWHFAIQLQPDEIPHKAERGCGIILSAAEWA